MQTNGSHNSNFQEATNRKPTEDYDYIEELAQVDVHTLLMKGVIYGQSWKKRGGAGAIANLQRKWDRIEHAAQALSGDLFTAIRRNPGVLEDVADLRRYLFLVESEMRLSMYGDEEAYAQCSRTLDCPITALQDIADEEPSSGYVNQD